LLLPPWPWSKVAAKEAPHWESDVTPTDTKDVAQAPAGVSIQAPDGFSYGDEYSWGALDQRALVEQLTEVRAAAGF
jgi:phosphoribosylformylglycinamidine (FGAM) synthase-like amidotransferase family enzyme